MAAATRRRSGLGAASPREEGGALGGGVWVRCRRDPPRHSPPVGWCRVRGHRELARCTSTVCPPAFQGDEVPRPTGQNWTGLPVAFDDKREDCIGLLPLASLSAARPSPLRGGTRRGVPLDERTRPS